MAKTVEELELENQNLQASLADASENLAALNKRLDLLEGDGKTLEQLQTEEVKRVKVLQVAAEEKAKGLEVKLAKIAVQQKYPNVPTDLISGSTEAEMIASAEKIHTLLKTREDEITELKKKGLSTMIPGGGGGDMGGGDPNVELELANAKKSGDTLSVIKTVFKRAKLAVTGK